MKNEKKVHIIDISNNKKDLSNNFIPIISGHNNNNPYIRPLEVCNKKKKENYKIYKKERETNIKSNDFKFNMGLDDILDKMRKKRAENYAKKPYAEITKYLDKQPLLLKNISEKDSLSKLLVQINKKYNTIQSSVPLQVPIRSYKILRRQSILNTPIRIPPPLPDSPPIKKVNIDVEVNSLKDIIKLCEDYPLELGTEYNINMQAIHNIKTPLIELDNMIGLNSLKISIMDQILYYIQDLHEMGDSKNGDFLHTVIYGPPGTGKTEVAKIMGNIFSKMGLLKRNVFRKATRSDLIAGYLGQTAIKTREVIKDCLGGVLFIDEAYSLGNPEKRDSFAKECIDTLCEALSDHKDNLMVIIAGYEDELKTCFFDYNQGLDSRFTWRFKTNDYTAIELKYIFEKKVKDAKWDFLEPIPLSWFEKKITYFKFFGRDMETLFAKTKISHSRRIFCKDKTKRKKITLSDLDKGFDIYCNNNEVKSRKSDTSQIMSLYL